MDIATQIVFILFNLAIAAGSVAAIGKTPEGSDRYTGMAWAAFMYGIFTVAIILWWDTPDLLTLAAKCFIIATLWLPWVVDLADMHKPYEEHTFKQMVVHMIVTFLRIAPIVVFWVL